MYSPFEVFTNAVDQDAMFLVVYFIKPCNAVVFFFFGMGFSFQWCVWIGLVSIFLLYVIHYVFLAYIEGVWLFLVVFMVPSVALYILDYL